jgi:hypothetical protein
VSSPARRRLAKAGLGLLAAALPFGARSRALPQVAGVVWQLHGSAPQAHGNWHRLGARELLVQWTAVDGVAYVRGTGLREASRLPDWERIAREPWAERVIVGLSARFDEQTARRSLDAMLAESLRIARLRFPFRVSGWYFPAEVDPNWKDAPRALPPVLAKLPRPLWITIYDTDDIGAKRFADWIASFIPGDVQVLFQDSVGVGTRSPAAAREYADALSARLGRHRVAIEVEAFRTEQGKFRPATAAELRAQLPAFEGYRLYLFDGPHYVSERVVEELVAS